jgi:stage III sporulation protein AE
MIKKIMLFIVIVFCMVIMGQINVSAEEYNDTFSDIVHKSGVDMLDDDLSVNTESFFDENNISADNPESILDIGIEDIFSEILDEIKENIYLPFKLFSSLTAVTMLSSLAGSLGSTIRNNSSSKVFNMVCVLVSVSVISEPVSRCFYNCAENIRAGAVFMTGFVPVFSGITASGGGVSSALSYSTLIFTISQIAIHLADSVLIPVLSMCTALSIVDAVSPAVSLSALISGFQKFTTRFLGFIMMIFTGLISIQSIVGTSADNLAVKTGKYMVSNFVPVVGSAVSDAYTTLKSSMILLRSGTGSFGIIAILITILPAAVYSALYYLSVKSAFIISDMFGEKSLSKLYMNISSVLSVVFSVTVCFAVIMIISTAVVMMVGMGSV